MHIRNAVSLKKYSTMRLGGPAAHLAEIKDRDGLIEAVAWANKKNLPVVMIGSGSNIVWTDGGYPGLVLVNQIKRFEVFKEDAGNVYITVGGGENWDSVVKRTVKRGLSGIEALSLIPGTTGATPVQNVGAYGQEIANVLVSVEAYDRQSNTFVIIPRADCGFSYRTSRFKTTDKGRFLITGVTLHLSRTNPKPPFYPALQAFLDQHHISDYTPKTIRQAVNTIRTSKLPDPAVVANNGSFFANPIVSKDRFEPIYKMYPEVAHWFLADGTVKISAAWLIDAAGFKDFHDPDTGMATWPWQSLVLVNEHAESTDSLIEFKQKIVVKVRYLFGLTLEQEPELMGV